MIMKWIFGTSAVVGVATLALGLILVSTGSPATGNPDDTRNLASTLVTDGDGTSEGIQVHGDWTIEVSDPDGNLVERREFKNALTNEGAYFVVDLLQGLQEVVQNTWEIELTYDRMYKRWAYDASGQNTGYNVITTTDTGGVGVIEVGWGYLIAKGFSLSGSLVVEKNFYVTDDDYFTQDTITSVGTSVQSKDFNLSANDFVGGSKNSFTEHTLDVPLKVTSGNTINVTVKISFN